MKAQISIEYLLLSVVTLAVLAISVGALLKIKDNAEKSQGLLLLKNDADNIYNSMQEVCAMGSGNIRTLGLSQNVHLESNSKYLSISNMWTSIPKNLSCECTADGWFEGNIVLSNNNGKIIVSKY